MTRMWSKSGERVIEMVRALVIVLLVILIKDHNTGEHGFLFPALVAVVIVCLYALRSSSWIRERFVPEVNNRIISKDAENLE